MVGSGLKKLAAENGMKIAQGVAYGNLQGFAATMVEGSNIKILTIATRFFSEEQKNQMIQAANAVDVTRTYRVQKLDFGLRTIQIVFTDTIGTMKKIRAFVDWFIPLLRQNGAFGWNVCSECGTEITAGRWVLVNGIAYYLHEACAEKVSREIEEENIRQQEDATGSYAAGTVGALLGSLVGSVLWAIVLNMGYVASLVGFVIGWLAEKGYNLFKGKQGKAKVAILIVAVIIGVLVGNFAADAFTLVGMINSGELPGVEIADIPSLILLLLFEDSEYLSATLGNVAIGLLFAGLGVFALLRKAGQEVAGQKYIVLE